MKKLLLAMVMLALVTSLGFAGNAFNKGDNTGQVGLGIGLGGLYGTSSVPPITVAFERGIEPKIGIGGVLGYASSTDDFGFGWSWKYTYIVVGARGAYHFLEDNENTDAYAGAILGYNVVSASWNGSGAQPGGYSASASYMLFGGLLGGRYWFAKKVGVYAEVGYGVGYINGGVCFRL